MADCPVRGLDGGHNVGQGRIVPVIGGHLNPGTTKIERLGHLLVAEMYPHDKLLGHWSVSLAAHLFLKTGQGIVATGMYVHDDAVRLQARHLGR